MAVVADFIVTPVVRCTYCDWLTHFGLIAVVYLFIIVMTLSANYLNGTDSKKENKSILLLGEFDSKEEIFPCDLWTSRRAGPWNYLGNRASVVAPMQPQAELSRRPRPPFLLPSSSQHGIFSRRIISPQKSFEKVVIIVPWGGGRAGRRLTRSQRG